MRTRVGASGYDASTLHSMTVSNKNADVVVEECDDGRRKTTSVSAVNNNRRAPSINSSYAE